MIRSIKEYGEDGKMARPSKRTDERAEVILRALREGHTRKYAAACSGISEDTFSNWRSDDLEFLAAVEQAEADSVAALVSTIKRASETDWRAAAWLLERRHHDQWGSRKERLEVEDKLSTQALVNSLFKALP